MTFIPPGQAPPGLPAYQGQRAEEDRAEAHGRLDHQLRQELHLRQAGGRGPQEVRRRPQGTRRRRQVNADRGNVLTLKKYPEEGK